MQNELEALTKENQAIRKENEALQAKSVTPMTPLCNVIPTGLVDTTLASVEYYMETEAVNLRQANKSKCIERLKRAENSESFDVANWDQRSVTPSLMESPSLYHIGANDPMGAYIGR